MNVWVCEMMWYSDFKLGCMLLLLLLFSLYTGRKCENVFKHQDLMFLCSVILNTRGRYTAHFCNLNKTLAQFSHCDLNQDQIKCAVSVLATPQMVIQEVWFPFPGKCEGPLQTSGTHLIWHVTKEDYKFDLSTRLEPQGSTFTHQS